MQENHDYLGAKDDPNMALKGQVLVLQLKGAAYAAAFCLVLVLGILAVAWVGRMLPEESRDTFDPTPLSFEMTIATPVII